jgi:hypothetical protein
MVLRISNNGGRMAPLRSDDGITRRDFINGMLVATGSAMAGSFGPRGAEACVDIGKNVCDGPIGLDARALRGGNLPAAFKVAHWLRDERLSFSRNSVRLKASACDDRQGTFPIEVDGGTYDVIIAGSGMSGLAAAFYLTRRRDWLIPGAIDGDSTAEILVNPVRADRLDLASNAVRVRQSAMVVRADTSSKGASVVYHLDGRFFRASARAVILAGQGHTAHRVALHLIGDAAHDAWCDLTLVPVVIANVTLRRAAPLVDLGLGYNQYWWGSKYWADFVVADWVTSRRFDRDRSLTVYGANVFPPDAMYEERVKLLSLPFSEYEQSLREDLNRVLAVAPGGFDFDRDVSAVYIYRWGHGMVFPKLGVPFGPPQMRGGQAIRTPAGRHVARAPVGRLSFAGQDTESSPAIESAIGSGLRTALEALAWL